MKNVILILTAACFFAIIGFTSCSSDNKKNEVEDVDLGLNIGNPKLDNKSGGVYFVSTYAGEYIFRLNLKNGNDLMICEMFHDDKYSDLTAEKRDWEVGENLTLFEFSKDNIQLLISLDQDGEPQSKFLYNDQVWETVVYKSTAKEPVKIYSGTTESFYEEKIEFKSSWDEVMILKNKHYFYGLIQSGLTHEDYCTIFKEITKLKDNKLTYDVPDHPNDPEGNYAWERTVDYSETELKLNIIEDLGDYDGTWILNHLLLRRFQ